MLIDHRYMTLLPEFWIIGWWVNENLNRCMLYRKSGMLFRAYSPKDCYTRRAKMIMTETMGLSMKAVFPLFLSAYILWSIYGTEEASIDLSPGKEKPRWQKIADARGARSRRGFQKNESFPRPSCWEAKEEKASRKIFSRASWIRKR